MERNDFNTIHERLDQLEGGVKELKAWTTRHEDEHNSQTKLLSSIVDTITGHDRNHHGKASQLKQGGLLSVATALLLAGAELLRRFFLPFP